MSTQLRNQKILAWRGIISYGLIAEKLGISRNVVAGVCWRADWPYSERVKSPNSHGGNKCGLGQHGGGKYAMRTMNDSLA